MSYNNKIKNGYYNPYNEYEILEIDEELFEMPEEYTKKDFN